MRFIAFILAAIPLFAVCPTDSGYTKTCFVSLSGNDTTGDGTIGNPYATGTKALQTAAGDAGTRIYFRGGTWTSYSAVKITPADMFACTAPSRCFYGGMPGEQFHIDARSWGTSDSWVASGAPSIGSPPSYSGYTTDFNYWTIGSVRITNIPRQVIWIEQPATGLELVNIRASGSIGITMYNCDSCAIKGVHFTLQGTNKASGNVQGHGFDCSPTVPSVNIVPWRGTSYAVGGSSSIVPNLYQLENVTPDWGSFSATGCEDLLVDGSKFTKNLQNAADVFGAEIGKNITVINSQFEAPKYVNSGTDSFDLKAFGISMKNVVSRYGKNGIKAWGKTNLDGVLSLHTLNTSAEAAITFGGSMGTCSSCYPTNEIFNPIRWAGNTLGGDAYIVSGPGAYGNSPEHGQRITIANVPGCTSINKEVRVKSTPNGKHTIFVLENTDGTQLACNSAYDDTALTYQTHSTTATFTGGGSANIVLASAIPTTGTWTYPSSKLNSRLSCTSTGTLPPEISSGQTLYLKSVSGSTITVTATPQAGTGGSSAITFSGDGTGTHTCIIQDDYNASGGGEMYPTTNAANKIADWGGALRNVTALSENYNAISVGENMDNSGYAGAGFTYDMRGVIAYAKRNRTVTAVEMFFGGPRALANASDDYIYLAYYDVGAMAVNDRVSFRCATVPDKLGIATPLDPDVEYYVVTSDSGGSRIQVSTTLGGGAINITAEESGRCWAIFQGLSTTYIETSTLTGVSTTNTFKMDSQGGSGLPYPFDGSTTYTVSTTSSPSVNGTTVYLMTVHSGGADIAHATRIPGPHWYVEGGANGSGAAMTRGSYTKRAAGSGNNLIYTGNGTPTVLLEGDTGFPGNITNTSELQAVEDSDSCISDPALDVTNGRATASTPSCAQNKGYYAAFHETLSIADTTAILKNKFPVACATETCTVEVDNNSDFSSVTETTTVTSGGQWQSVIVGKSTPLTASTTYYYRLTQGYDVVKGSFATASTLSGTAAASTSIGASADAVHTHARLDVSTDGSSWTTGTNTSCASGCTLSSAAIAKGNQYVRMVRTNSGGTVLGTGAAEPFLVQ